MLIVFQITQYVNYLTSLEAVKSHKYYDIHKIFPMEVQKCKKSAMIIFPKPGAFSGSV